MGIIVALCAALAAPNGVMEQRYAALLRKPPLNELFGDFVGAKGNVVTIRDPATKIVRQVPLVGPLTRGAVLPSGKENLGYHPDDLRVGDVIYIVFVGPETDPRGIAIQLWDRPNDFFPESRIAVGKKGQRYHDVKNAVFAHNKFGTPLPDFLKPLAKPLPPSPDKK